MSTHTNPTVPPRTTGRRGARDGARSAPGRPRATRNTLDLAAVPLLGELSHLPVIVDPSHGTGLSALVPPLAKAALAVGADGLIVEVHPDPACALSDGPQSLTFEGFAALMDELQVLSAALGRPMSRSD